MVHVQVVVFPLENVHVEVRHLDCEHVRRVYGSAYFCVLGHARDNDVVRGVDEHVFHLSR